MSAVCKLCGGSGAGVLFDELNPVVNDIEMKNKCVINIIPDDYVGNHREALGYCWADFVAKVPGIDVIVSGDGEAGIDYADSAFAKMKEIGASEAHVNCMWCGGFRGRLSFPEMFPPGVCDKCESYCFGDCEAAESEV